MRKLNIVDALDGHIHISKNKYKYLKTKDSASPSGHSLYAQIDMTHAGIVTRNYGFYLPTRMRDGAHTFVKDYAKPLLIGHDDDSLPVGRVVQADYIDTSKEYKAKDSYIRELYTFSDAKKKNKTIDLVQHIIKNYDGADGYKGLGHIRGLVKITDPKVIEGVLDNTFLTVSTSMVSDSAVCSICGTDWVRDGLCEHQRGHLYEDKVCVVIPGEMSYDHLGIVNTPADPHAHDFVIVGDNDKEKDETIVLVNNNMEDSYKTSDSYDLAAQLFACNDNTIVSLASESDANLLEIKNNIQKMESAMKKEGINTRIKDELSVRMTIFRYGSDKETTKEVSVSEYVSELSEESLQKMVSQIATMVGSDSADVTAEEIQTAIDKYCEENFTLVDSKSEENELKEEKTEDEVKEKEEGAIEDKKKCKKKAKKMSDNFKLEDADEIEDQEFEDAVEALKNSELELTDKEMQKVAEVQVLLAHEDALMTLVYGDHSDSAETIYKKMQDLAEAPKLADLDAKAVYELMAKHIDEEKRLSDEQYDELKSSDFCGMKGFFPVVDADHYAAVKKVLAEINMTNSVRGRILSAVEKKAKKLELDLTDNFDNKEEACNNNDNVNVEDLIKQFEDARSKLEELGVEIPGLQTTDSVVDKDQEIAILEAQLEAANEELDTLSVEFKELKDNLTLELATRTVDMKILSGSFKIDDREVEIENHKKRNLDSLKDGLKDLEQVFNIQNFTKETGMEKAPTEQVVDPTLKQNDEVAKQSLPTNHTEENKYKIYDDYYRRVATYGKKAADRWLAKVQKQNGSVQTID